MSDDRRVYSDQEFALILRQAAELASRSDPSGPSSAGLTLGEMKAAAAQVGIDPALVERAARQMAARVTASPLERVIGGPLRHDHQARFPITLDENAAARLLSAVRISAGPSGSGVAGHSGQMGMTWQDGGEAETFSVTARPGEEGTSVSVVVDRRGTLVTVTVVSGMAMFLTTLFAGAVVYEAGPALAGAAAIAGIGGVLAAARGYWAASTRSVRERISRVMDAVGQTLTQPDPRPSAFAAVGNGDAAPESDAPPREDADSPAT